MLVVCPCGKKLNIADTLTGKKVRCPVCKDVFLAQPDDSDQMGNVSIPKEQSKSRPEESLLSKQRQPLSTKQQQQRPVEEDADLLEEYEEEQSRSSNKKRQDAPSKKSGTGLVRNIISSVILVALLIGAAVVFWYKFQPSGTVTFDIRTTNFSVFVDGKELSLTNSSEMGTVSLTLSPGTHEVKITKKGCQPYLKQVTVKSGDDDRFEVFLFPTTPPRVATKSDLVVSLESLFADVGISDLAALKRRYVGQIVVTSGSVASINKFEGNALGVVINRGEQPIMNKNFRMIQGASVVCEFNSPVPAKIAALQPGQQIKVRGECKNFLLTVVELTKVELLEP